MSMPGKKRRAAVPRGGRQRGVAVVTALLLTTLAITIVASLFWQQQVQVRSIENQRLQLQKQWILRGALDWARLILREDARFSAVDTLDEPWAVPLVETRLDQYVENDRAGGDAADATLSGSIVDAQSRYNLNNLSVNGVVNPVEVKAFSRLLTNVRLNPSLAQATADLIAASQPKAQTGVTGDNSSRPLALAQLDDLLAVPGFTVDALAKLKDFVIFLPRVTPVNINTAPVEVLAARIDTLSVSDANVLVAARKTASFRNIADLAQRLPGIPTPSANDLSVKTDFFLVNGKVSMSRAGLEVQALIERNNNTTKLVWIHEN
jgi:general secretion pathway protein K